jgi:hypothetical protein
MTTTILLVDRAVNEADAAELTSLHEGERERFVVLLPVSGGGHGLLAALDDVALADFEDVVKDLEEPEASEAAVVARDALDHTVRLLTECGAAASGVLVSDKPLRVLPKIARRYQADEIVVLVEPHFIEEFLHTDWASRARRATGLPTLKLVPHRASAGMVVEDEPSRTREPDGNTSG